MSQAIPQQADLKSNMSPRPGQKVLGWTAVLFATSISSWWAFWGTIEAFHEGWCKPELGQRLLQLLAYLSITLVLTTLTALAIRWPRVGAVLFAALGVAIGTLILATGARFGVFLTTILMAIPILVGVLFFLGRPVPRRLAYALAIGLPVVLILACGMEPAWRVSRRFDDGDRGARVVEGNGVALMWAPAGPGWTREGLLSWDEAVQRARYLTADGLALAEEPQDIWRLPTREEIVRSLTRANKNAGGKWDPERELVRYEITPDKESPLWDPFAPLVYLWTADEASESRAWIVVYHGGVYAKQKAVGSPSFGMRAVREVGMNR